VPHAEKKTSITPADSASTSTATPTTLATTTFHTASTTGTVEGGEETNDQEEAEAEQEEGEGDEGDEEQAEDEQLEADTAEGSAEGKAKAEGTADASTEVTTPTHDPFWGDDPEGEWITASNIHLHKNRVKKTVAVADLSDVGCITTDFAMQNVMIAMGLRLLSVRGLAITTIRTHVRRCHACWAVELNMEKDNNFCRVCGGHTLMKAVFHINANGVPRYYMSQKAINNKRGTVYSIPKFRGGRHNKDLILREDAMKSTKLHAHKKKVETPFEDSIEFGYGKVGSKVSVQHAAEQFGYGRRNPNVVQPSKRDKNKRNHRRK